MIFSIKSVDSKWMTPCCLFIARYNTLFSFLLSIKRVQLELQQCWALQMQRGHAPPDPPGGVAAPPGGGRGAVVDGKWWLRNHMAFLVDNLQYYIQVRLESDGGWMGRIFWRRFYLPHLSLFLVANSHS